MLLFHLAFMDLGLTDGKCGQTFAEDFLGRLEAVLERHSSYRDTKYMEYDGTFKMFILKKLRLKFI